MKEKIITTLGVVVILAIGAGYYFNANYRFYTVSGDSMVPTLHDNQRVLVSKVYSSTFNYLPARGTVILFEKMIKSSAQGHASVDEKMIVVRRVLALPGDRVEIHNGQLTVYLGGGQQTEQPYGDAIMGVRDVVVSVPENQLYVGADNHTSTESLLDSRTGLGTVPIVDIIGEVNR